MFKANPSNNYVSSKSISIKPEAMIDYGSSPNSNQIKFLIPQYLGFINPSQSYLKFKLTMQGRGRLKPDWRAGAHSLIRNFRIQDGTGSQTLEEIQDYNVLTAQWWKFTENDSIADKREMFEGRNRTHNSQGQLFNAKLPSSANGVAGPVTANEAQLTVEVMLPLNSGILSNNKVFPVLATKGLRLTLDLDTATNALVCASGTLGVHPHEISDPLNSQVSMLSGQPAADTAGPKVCGDNAGTSGTDPKGAVDSVFTVTVSANADNNPFRIGDILYINVPVASDGTRATDREQALGVVTGFKPSDMNVSAKALAVQYIPNRATGKGLAAGNDYAQGVVGVGSSIYVKASDRERVNTFSDLPTGVPSAIDNAAAGYVIKDVEYVISQVQPPPEYVSRMMKQIQSGQGLTIDVKTFATYRHNLSTLNGLTDQLIPAQAQRAYSIISVPLALNKFNTTGASAFVGDLVGSQNYQYVFNGHLIPDRPVDLKRIAVAQKPGQVHLVEVEKTLTNCGYVVRNLQRLQDSFFIGRAFSKYGQVFNLKSADLNLRVEYAGVDSAMHGAKFFHHFVCHLRSINISNNGVRVMW